MGNIPLDLLAKKVEAGFGSHKLSFDPSLGCLFSFKQIFFFPQKRNS